MIEPLKERIKKEKEAYESILSKHNKVEQIIRLIPKKFHEKADLRIYSDGATFLIISLTDPFETELELVPLLSSALNIKWSKEVSAHEMSYYTWLLHENEISAYITIRLNLSDSCLVEKVATGRTKLVSQTVQVEVPEFTYVINCAETD